MVIDHMNNNSIKFNILKNGSVAGITFTVSVVMKFIVRTFFIKYFGEQYLGLNGLYTSIVQVLSLTDLGMEAAFAFVLYKPIAESDTDSIFKIVKNLKKIYEIVGVLVLIIGMLIVPFLKYIIGDNFNQLNHVVLIYFIFLATTVSSYFFTYSRTLFNADQRNYVIANINFFVTMIGNIIQILTIMYFKNPVLFSLLDLLITIVSNLLISMRVKRFYPFLSIPFDKNKVKLSYDIKLNLIKNSIGGFSNKIGSIIVFSSDNILISMFVGLSTVGIYNNYTMITNSVSGLISRIIQPMTASIGNMIIIEPEKSITLFNKFNQLIYYVLIFIIPQLFILLPPFIKWWIGEKYVLSMSSTILILTNITLQLFRQAPLTFIDAYGLQWVQKWKAIIESIINMGFSLVFILVFHMGLDGILVGTTVSTIITVSWYEPYVVFKHGFHDIKLIKKFTIDYCKRLLTISIVVSIAWTLTKNMSGEGLPFLILLSLTSLGVSGVVYSFSYLNFKILQNK